MWAGDADEVLLPSSYISVEVAGVGVAVQKSTIEPG